MKGRWEGRVIEVSDEEFTAELTNLEDESVVYADFSRNLCESVEPGDIVDIVAEDGVATITLRDLGRWTEEEIAAIQMRGAQDAAEMRRWVR